MIRRKRLMIVCLIYFAMVLLPSGFLQAAPLSSPIKIGPQAENDGVPIHHDIKVTLHPETHRLEVEDTVTLSPPLRQGGGELVFFLHGGLHPASATPGVELKEEKGALDPSGLGIDPSALQTGLDFTIKRYRVTLPEGADRFTLRYAGQIHHPVHPEGEASPRSMSDTPGSISSDGIFLAASSFWYPVFPEELVSFTLDLKLPGGWDGVSQGRRTAHSKTNQATAVRWESPEPQDEIYLAGNRFTEYSRPAGRVTAMAFLQTPDPALAEKYLEVTGQYLQMYEKLIGPYPYTKFALVENFWDSGYGMPSFTLLGPRIIRFPFILHSSYPHEILHNWWGNGVFVDFQSGNWSEGLTAYLADHLISEQRGGGAVARRAVLQKYADYVSEGKDFPLTDFRSRHSAATEAVGYGKTLMFFHMLRLELGDDLFIKGLQAFYRENRFRRAGFSDLEQAFSKAAGKALKGQFDRWIKEPGAPILRLSDPSVQAGGEGTRLTARLNQIQPGAPYPLRVPIAVTLEGREEAYQTTVTMDRKEMKLDLTLPGRPLRIDVDPEFDLFRRLDRNEIPPALSQAFGASRTLIVLPSAAEEKLRAGYRRLAEGWKGSQPGEIEIRLDTEIDEIPNDRAVWLFGWENRFRPKMAAALADDDVSLGASTVRLGKTELDRRRHSIVLSGRHPSNPDLALTWLATDIAAALPGLERKLPHYGRYGYLGFEGDEPQNVEKGEWPVTRSPMTVSIPKPGGTVMKVPRAKGAGRPALAALPPVFSEARMLGEIRFLAGDALQGRGFGTPGLDRAADHIAAAFREAGLQPGGEDGSYFQTFKARGGDPERDAILKNVVGFIPGKKPEWKTQSVIVGAHYDHLGLGWPGARTGEVGKIHFGADDNASGVAVLLELARSLGKGAPDRSVVFVAFSGEETGLTGSRHYVAHEKRFPAKQAIGMLNMDTVGRLGSNKLSVFGTGSAREWVHLFNGAGFVTGVPIEAIEKNFGSSDQKSFIDAGVPAVQLFSGVNLDFHRPTDTADKIDAAGLVNVAAVMKEAIEYLSSRPEPLTSSLVPGAGGPSGSPAPPPPGRRVSFGTVPDFAYEGKGVRLSGVAPGSPAEKAGLKAGDVIVRAGTVSVDDLRGFADLLNRFQPGESVAITFVRDGQAQTVELEAVSR